MTNEEKELLKNKGITTELVQTLSAEISIAEDLYNGIFKHNSNIERQVYYSHSFKQLRSVEGYLEEMKTIFSEETMRKNQLLFIVMDHVHVLRVRLLNARIMLNSAYGLTLESEEGGE